MQRLFTGLQPSGALHIGNYFGVLNPLIGMQKDHEGFLMVADYHALTTLKNPDELRKNIFDITRDYVAAGIDTNKLTIFQQSQVPEHTELTWIFNTLVTIPFLELAHAYKDKEARGLEANVGLFDYPVLMASDILLYDTDVVPVGMDQQQHIEYARDIAGKFNNTYGELFKLPKAQILQSVAVVPGTDGKKMSKSYKNTIPLFGTKEEIEKAVMSIVTDSKGERPENVYAIHTLFRDEKELASIYKNNQGNYKALKEALTEDIEAVVAPMREKRSSISDADVKKILKGGSEKAREVASKKMSAVRKAVGVTL